MTRRRIGVAGIVVLMIAIRIWAVLPKHGAELRRDEVAKERLQFELTSCRVYICAVDL